MISINCLPKNLPWKVILPAPYTFVHLSENQFYKNNSEFMLTYAQILNEEIKELAKLGFNYVQLSDPALVHSSMGKSLSEDELDIVNEALRMAVEGAPIRTCLQTFFGDFSLILPAVLDFPVDDLGIDLYETKFDQLKEYTIQKGVALGVTDSRSSLIENPDELVAVTNTVLKTVCSKSSVFICPNCDLVFIPWALAREKMRVVGVVAKRLREEFDG
jgi:5-methyltetrahydropteroyltriglutamate--homocysteine methyltransferase